MLRLPAGTLPQLPLHQPVPPEPLGSPPCCQALPPYTGVAHPMCAAPMVGLERGETFTGRERKRGTEKGQEWLTGAIWIFLFFSPSVSHHAVQTSQGSPTLGFENPCIRLDSEKGCVGSSGDSESSFATTDPVSLTVCKHLLLSSFFFKVSSTCIFQPSLD